MTLANPIGVRGFCCCPDCIRSLDRFDCCLPPNGQSSTVPCCPENCLAVDYEAQTYETIPSQNLGLKWRVLSGQYWKMWSPSPQYGIPAMACNDGALWEVSGSGKIVHTVGWSEIGRAVTFNLLAPQPGTAFTVQVGCDIDGVGGFSVDVDFFSEAGIFKMTISVCGKVCTYGLGADPGIYTSIRYPVSIAISYTGFARVVVAGFVVWCCNVGPGSGWKVAFTQRSGSDELGPIPLIIDDFVLIPEVVYPNNSAHHKYSCFNFSLCWCTDEETGEQRIWLPNTLYMVIQSTCKPSSDPATWYDEEVHVELHRKPPAACDTCSADNLDDRWESEDVTVCGMVVQFEQWCTSALYVTGAVNQELRLTMETCVPWHTGGTFSGISGINDIDIYEEPPVGW